MDKKENFNVTFNEEGLRLTDDDLTFSSDTADKIKKAAEKKTPAEPEKGTSRKEDMAKMIARNMASADSEANAPADEISYYTSAPTAVMEDKPKTENTAPKPRKPASKKKKKRKKKSSAGKKAAIILSVTVVLMLAAGAGIYLTGLNAYKGVFLDNTYINGINVSGMSPADALAVVSAKSTIPDKITITKKDGSEVNIKLEDIGYKDNTKQLISDYYAEQDHYSWLKSKFSDTEYTIENSFKYDKKLLEDIVKRKIVSAETSLKPQDAYIDKPDENADYIVVAEVDGDKVNSDKAEVLYNYIESALNENTFDINISKVDCYEKAKITAEDLYESCEKLNNLINIEINFDFNYTTETLTGDRIMDWIEFDTADPVDGYSVDEDKAMAYVEELADKYDTFGKDRVFKTTNRGTITIPEGQGCYGWWIDQEKTCRLICDLIIEGESTDTEPIYYENPYSAYSYTCNPEWRTAESDFSDTYFEVDLSAQHLWYYENGEVKMETDIVSGYPNESRNTPAGVYKLWLKERGKTLTGSSDGRSYSSYVEYWNNISTISIGFHDASWQNGVFGGEKYKSATWGSHGCINMPFDKAKYIYENCDYGIPVFAYWS